MNTLTREAILDALMAFANQRPGLDPANYGDMTSYRSESRSITKDLHYARELYRAVNWRSGIDAPALLEAFRAYSGRLTLRDDGTLDYCVGQYFPTEYRRAVCAVLASALWSYTRDHCMPQPVQTADGERYEGLRAGDWLRRHFRREFGRTIADRWFS